MKPRHSPDGSPPGGRGRPPLPRERGAGTERPPEPPRELEPDCEDVRAFDADGVEWLACVSGKSAGGTGGYGLALLQAVHFSRADEPAVPRFEALLPRGRFAGLFEDELRELLRRATPIRPVPPADPSR